MWKRSSRAARSALSSKVPSSAGRSPRSSQRPSSPAYGPRGRTPHPGDDRAPYGARVRQPFIVRKYVSHQGKMSNRERRCVPRGSRQDRDRDPVDVRRPDRTREPPVRRRGLTGLAARLLVGRRRGTRARPSRRLPLDIGDRHAPPGSRSHRGRARDLGPAPARLISGAPLDLGSGRRYLPAAPSRHRLSASTCDRSPTCAFF